MRDGGELIPRTRWRRSARWVGAMEATFYGEEVAGAPVAWRRSCSWGSGDCSAQILTRCDGAITSLRTLHE
jgi:hypothetical protein